MHALIVGEVDVGHMGGGESIVHGLVRGLSELSHGEDRYTVLCTPAMAEELRPWMGGALRAISRPPASPTSMERLKSALGPARRPLGRLFRKIAGRAEQGLPHEVPPLDPFIREQACDVVHFMIPIHYTSGDGKVVFSFHDLQHEHLPHLFDASHIGYRRMIYDTVSREGAAIVAGSRVAADDFRERHAPPAGKMFVARWASYVGAGKDEPLLAQDEEVLASIPPRFLLYPAYSYAHKNHRGLLRALSIAIREHGAAMPLVCTGGRSDEWQRILREWRELAPRPQLIDLGHTRRALLSALYRRARIVVFPTLFEGAGLPLIEAAQLGTPIACSDIPPLREYGGDAPLYFDPRSPQDMAAKLAMLWRNDDLRERIAARAAIAVRDLTWARCAATYRAIYRLVAGTALTPGDEQLLRDSRVD